jgi:hypothetical protein
MNGWKLQWLGVRFVVLLAPLALVFVMFPYASAEEKPDPGCVMKLKARKRTDPLPVPDPTVVPPTPECFNSFAEAINYATNGQVKMPKTASREEVKKAVEEYQKAKAKEPTASNGALSSAATTSGTTAADTASAQASKVIAYHYEHINFGGWYLIISGDYNCRRPDHMTYDLNVMPSGWNDRITSTEYVAGPNCVDIHHWSDGFLRGEVYYTTYESAWLEWMNDRTSSVRYWCNDYWNPDCELQ